MDTTDLAQVRRTLWAAADELRANSSLAPNEYRGPVLGLIFLAYAEHRFEQARPEVEAKATARRPVTPDDYRARSVLFIPDEARLSRLVNIPEGQDLGAAVDTAMRLVETHNAELRDVLPKGYQRLEKSTLVELLRLFSPLPRTLSGDAFGLIYEDFLSNFALAEGRLGGEFFTPHSIVRLIVEIIEPFHGRVFDPACVMCRGMFVQCAKFVERHQGSATRELSVYGQEQKEVTVPLAKMNLALHGLSGDIRLGNSYYDDLHHSAGAFDFVMANPPFNVNGVDKDKLAGDPRFRSGYPGRTTPTTWPCSWTMQASCSADHRPGSSTGARPRRGSGDGLVFSEAPSVSRAARFACSLKPRREGYFRERIFSEVAGGDPSWRSALQRNGVTHVAQTTCQRACAAGVSAPMRRTVSAVPRNGWHYEEGADLFLAGVRFAAGRRIGLGAMS